MSEEERDAFTNLILLCLGHHSEVDDKLTGEKLYPPEMLRAWKIRHEGSNGPALARLGSVNEEQLTALLTAAFAPPTERLQSIADQLEETGTLNTEAVRDLQQIVAVMADTPAGVDARSAASLAYAAEVFESTDLSRTAASLAAAAEQIMMAQRNFRPRDYY
jgi:hypothetical protein